MGCLSHAFSGAQKWAELLRQPSILGGPQQRGAKSELAASAMPSRGPKSGRKCYVTPAFSGVPNKGEQNQNSLPQPCLLGGPKAGGSATSPLHSWGSPTKGSKIRIGCLSHAFSGAQKWAEVLRHPGVLEGPQQRGAKSELAASAMPSRGPKVGGSAASPRCSRGSPTKGGKIRIGCLSHAFSGAQKWAEVLRHSCILGGPQQRGAKSEFAASTMPSRGPKSRRKCYVTIAFLGVPNKGEQNQNWLPQPCLLGGPKVGGSATSPRCSRGSPTKGSKIRIGCLSHAFSGP